MLGYNQQRQDRYRTMCVTQFKAGLGLRINLLFKDDGCYFSPKMREPQCNRLSLGGSLVSAFFLAESLMPLPAIWWFGIA